MITTHPIPASFIRGALELESTATGTIVHRLPSSARAQANGDPQLLMVEQQPSGVRIVFQTASTTIELDTERSRTSYAGAPSRPDGVIEIVVDGSVFGESVTNGGILTTIDMATGVPSREQGPSCTSSFTNLPAGLKILNSGYPTMRSLSSWRFAATHPFNHSRSAFAPVAAPRQLHQSRLQCHASDGDLARSCCPLGWNGTDKSRFWWQCPVGSFHCTHYA
ncbi:hypothetical protein NHF46_09550 [Arthrobacter alpinus]|nr:hypothetical protein [Arthrobacter alpinus]